MSIPPNNVSLDPPEYKSIPHGISIGSAVFAQLMAKHTCTLQWAALSHSILPLPMGNLDPI